MVETRGGRRFAYLFFIAAFLVLLLGRWLKPVDNVVLTVSAPFAAAISGVAEGIGDAISGVVHGPQLQAQNAALRREVGLLLHENLVLQEQAHENALLIRMVGFKDLNSRMDLLPARVILTEASGLPGYIIINRGARDGLRPGMTVVDQSGYFVGTVTSVMNTASKVLLMTSPSSSVAAMDQRTRAQGVVQGSYAGLPELLNVYTSAVLRKGDLVVTDGVGNLYPRTILLGQVTSVQRSDVQEFQTAQIQPAADFQNLELVQVVRNYPGGIPAKLLKP